MLMPVGIAMHMLLVRPSSSSEWIWTTTKWRQQKLSPMGMDSRTIVSNAEWVEARVTK
jgi:hypothetical protein